MSTPNTERFLNAFVAIEDQLRRLCAANRGVGFVALVDRAAAGNHEVRYYRDDLKEYAELRNAIVHERMGGQPIAEPYRAAVEAIEAIKTRLLEPPALLPGFRRDVMTCELSDKIGAAAVLMRDRDFSQLPVYDDGALMALLTAETIARWLGAALENGIGLIEEVSIVDVLPHTEDPDNYIVVPRGTTIYEALDAFDTYARRGKALAALIVTQKGKRTERPLSILTASDIPRLLELAAGAPRT